jgi:hypothetical protein
VSHYPVVKALEIKGADDSAEQVERPRTACHERRSQDGRVMSKPSRHTH